jgi:oligopeptide/dipeptide ABC transporter ATP-binding protein
MSENLLEIRHLKKYFDTPKGKLHAVDDVTFSIEKGKTLGIVGESGCGKSTLGRVILRLIEPTDGEILFEGKDLRKMSGREMRKMRSKMQLIFQDPFSSLNPRKNILQTLEEPLKYLGKYPDSDMRFTRVVELMDTVGLDRRLIGAYPHELDGGRRQRIGIARALAMEPEFIVCDEPVSALDVSIQAQVLNLLQEIQKNLGLTYIFITHNLSVAKHISDSIAVMYLGRIVEMASSDELFSNPMHPYTRALLSAIPTPNLHNRGQRIILKGELVSPIEPKPVCRFLNRCYCCKEKCKQTEPELLEVLPNHFVSCYLYKDN